MRTWMFWTLITLSLWSVNTKILTTETPGNYNIHHLFYILIQDSYRFSFVPLIKVKLVDIASL